MKILLFSDSHGIIENLLYVIDKENPDLVFHMGDLVGDARLVSRAYPNLPWHIVAGNCDGWCSYPEVEEVTVSGVRFFLTHGHRFDVKRGLDQLCVTGLERNADVVCFGHTHNPIVNRIQNTMWMINPGTAGGICNHATYGMISIDEKNINVEIKEISKDVNSEK